MNYILVAVGGMLGAMTRYFCVSLLADKSLNFPYSTFLVNVLGCFLIGAISEFFALKSYLPVEAKILLVTGFLGAFTTFSTFGLDTVLLINKSAFIYSMLYVFSSVFVGVLSIYLATFMIRSLFA